MNSPRYASTNFLWSELACPCCGCTHVSEDAVAKLQEVRDYIGRPCRVNSAARCPIHNVRVGGAPLSQHRATEERPSTAFDIAIGGYSKDLLIAAAEAAGFHGIGINYHTFVHMDDRPSKARW
jgi:hypothetical protein